MSRLRLQVGAIVLTMLAFQGICLWALGWVGAPSTATLLTTLAVAVVFTGLSQWVLQPLAHDFATLRALISSSVGEEPPASTAKVAEMAQLYEAVGLLRRRSLELEELERQAQRAVEDAERMRVSFVATMGHDLRGPLNAILGFADLLVMEGEQEVDSSQKQSVAIIRRSAQDLLVLLDQILDWARFEAGRIALEPAEVDLDYLLPIVAHEAEERSDDRGMRVAIDVPAPLPALELDAKRISQALLGLMDHATREAEGPAIELRAALAEARGERPAGVLLTVRDPKLQIRQADHDTFFEAFRPSYAPGGKRIAGLGLGPALARVLVRAHGGDVWFESRPDIGTTFSVLLPCSSVSASTRA